MSNQTPILFLRHPVFDSTFRVDVITSLQEAQEKFELQMGLEPTCIYYSCMCDAIRLSL